MIEVDLSPGGERRRGRGLFQGMSLSLPSLRGVPADPWVLAPAALVVIGLGAIGYLYLSVSGTADELEVEIEAAVDDSARYAETIERTEALQARRDTIAERVGLIQELDEGRYLWPRILDEVAGALPQLTWLSEVVEIGGGEEPDFRIQGSAGNYFALTGFMESLEDSPFIRNVRLVSTDQVAADGEDEQFVHQFILEASRDDPPSEAVETIPLFPDGSSAAVQQPERETLDQAGGGS